MKARSVWGIAAIAPVLIFYSASSAVLHAAPRSAPQATAQAATIDQELKDVDQRWLHAASTQDGDALKQIFADGMFEVQKGGVVVTGAEMRKTLTLPGRHIQIDIDDVEVRGVYGNTAVITDRTKQEGVAPDGRKISGLYTVLRVLRKENGEWHAIGAEMTPLQASTAATPMLDAASGKDNPATSAVEQELIDLDHKWVDAATHGDTAFLKTLFGERMFEVQSDGHAASAEEMLKGIATRKPGQIEGYCDQIQIRGVYGGDTAILTDRRVRKGIAADGRDISGQWRVTRVFVKQDGKWRAVAAAMTPIA